MNRAEQLNQRAWAAYEQRSMERGAMPTAEEIPSSSKLSPIRIETVHRLGKEDGSQIKEDKR